MGIDLASGAIMVPAGSTMRTHSAAATSSMASDLPPESSLDLM
jgi:hypothetical protein